MFWKTHSSSVCKSWPTVCGGTSVRNWKHFERQWTRWRHSTHVPLVLEILRVLFRSMNWFLVLCIRMYCLSLSLSLVLSLSETDCVFSVFSSDIMSVCLSVCPVCLWLSIFGWGCAWNGPTETVQINIRALSLNIPTGTIMTTIVVWKEEKN